MNVVVQKVDPEQQTEAALIDLNNVFPWSSTHWNQLSITCDYEISRPGETTQCTLCNYLFIILSKSIHSIGGKLYYGNSLLLKFELVPWATKSVLTSCCCSITVSKGATLNLDS